MAVKCQTCEKKVSNECRFLEGVGSPNGREGGCASHCKKKNPFREKAFRKANNNLALCKWVANFFVTKTSRSREETDWGKGIKKSIIWKSYFISW